MSALWYYRVFGEEFGPLSLNDLREAASNGTLSDHDEVRPEALSMWVPAKAVRELEDLFGASDQGAIESESKITESGILPGLDEWYYRTIDDQATEVGPFPFDGIIELAKSGRLSADDEVRLGVDSKWRRAGSMGRLVAVLPYQTKRRNNSPAPMPVTQADPLKEMISALPEADVEESPSEVVAEEPVVERKTPRPKSVPLSEANDDPAVERKTPQPKSKPRKKPMKSVEAVVEEPLTAEQEQEIEDQILQELMTQPAPAPAATYEAPTSQTMTPPMSTPSSAPAAAPTWTSNPTSSSSSSASKSISTPIPPTRAPVKPFKPARSGPSLLERLKDPNTLKGAAAVALVGLGFAWFSSGAGNGADVARYRELDALFTELKEIREKDKDGKKFIPFKEKFLQTAKRIQGEVEKTASPDYPARQRILWATKTNMPAMVELLSQETVAEKQALTNLTQAAYVLGLKEAPKVELVSD